MRKQCPKCKYGWSWKLNDGRYKCRKCDNRYIFQNIWKTFRLPDKTKKRLLEFFVLGVPAYRLRFRGGADLKTIEKFFLFIRSVLCIVEECAPMLDGIVECDEALFGGRRKGKRGWGAAGKVLVFGMLKRNGLVKVIPISSREAETLLPLIQKHTKPGSLYYTDDWHAYGSLNVRGGHVIINKEKGRPKGRDHINGIEGFWSYAKHWLYIYRGTPKKFFHIYLSEISFRFNNRDKDLFPIIYQLLQRYTADDIKIVLVRN